MRAHRLDAGFARASLRDGVALQTQQLSQHRDELHIVVDEERHVGRRLSEYIRATSGPSESEIVEEEKPVVNTLKSSSTEEPIERVNFKETQLFTKFIQTKRGRYSGSFKLTDLITKFQFTVDAVSSKGVYGALTSTFDSNKPFYIESNIPLFLTNGDKISVPLVINNNNPISVTVDVTASTTSPNNELSIQPSQSRVTVPAHSSKSVTMKLSARQQTKDKFDVKVYAKCVENYSDSFTKQTRIIGRGFPVQFNKGGFIGTNGDKFESSASLNIDMSDSYETGSLEAKAKLYTSQLSNIHEALEKLIRVASSRPLLQHTHLSWL